MSSSCVLGVVFVFVAAAAMSLLDTSYSNLIVCACAS